MDFSYSRQLLEVVDAICFSTIINNRYVIFSVAIVHLKFLFLTTELNLFRKTLPNSKFTVLLLCSLPGHSQFNGPAGRIVGMMKRSMDLNPFTPLENEFNRFLYTYNYTPIDAAFDKKSPVEIFFGCTLRHSIFRFYIHSLNQLFLLIDRRK